MSRPGRSPNSHGLPAMSSGIPKQGMRDHLVVRAALVLIGLAYVATSAVVAVNGFVWLPPLPSPWYRLQDILYWPFQPYFDLTLQALGSPDIPYSVFAVVTRIPFLALGSVLMKLSLQRSRTRT